ncbi:hypothetical protein DFS34DRAFT_664934 [Phlyctochytrium arcticum]|nr:hypothetical protein DFS34DRAFT_664934 [Phlyctochytrium arcticum]
MSTYQHITLGKLPSLTLATIFGNLDEEELIDLSKISRRLRHEISIFYPHLRALLRFYEASAQLRKSPQTEDEFYSLDSQLKALEGIVDGKMYFMSAVYGSNLHTPLVSDPDYVVISEERTHVAFIPRMCGTTASQMRFFTRLDEPELIRLTFHEYMFIKNLGRDFAIIAESADFSSPQIIYSQTKYVNDPDRKQVIRTAIPDFALAMGFEAEEDVVIEAIIGYLNLEEKEIRGCDIHHGSNILYGSDIIRSSPAGQVEIHGGKIHGEVVEMTPYNGTLRYKEQFELLPPDLRMALDACSPSYEKLGVRWQAIKGMVEKTGLELHLFFFPQMYAAVVEHWNRTAKEPVNTHVADQLKWATARLDSINFTEVTLPSKVSVTQDVEVSFRSVSCAWGIYLDPPSALFLDVSEDLYRCGQEEAAGFNYCCKYVSSLPFYMRELVGSDNYHYPSKTEDLGIQFLESEEDFWLDSDECATLVQDLDCGMDFPQPDAIGLLCTALLFCVAKIDFGGVKFRKA